MGQKGAISGESNLVADHVARKQPVRKTGKLHLMSNFPNSITLQSYLCVQNTEFNLFTNEPRL